MQKRLLFSAGVVVILLLGLGLVTRGDDGDEVAFSELRRLQQTLERTLGPQARQDLGRECNQDRVSDVLHTLNADEVTDQQLRESIVLLAKEALTLRERVEQLERRTSICMIPSK